MPPCASACHVPDARSWRSEIPRAPEPPPQLPPTMLRESASDRDVTSASARSVGRSSPCRPAPQAASWSSSSVLHPLQGGWIDVTNYGRAASCRLAERTRSFTAEYKQRILAEADRAKNEAGGIGALLRREGLYSSHLVTWRQERAAGILHALTPQKRGPKSKRSALGDENQKLRRENQHLSEELRKAEIVIDIQKKVAALLGRPICTPEREPKL